jgi:hypothetical protein
MVDEGWGVVLDGMYEVSLVTKGVWTEVVFAAPMVCSMHGKQK